MLDSVEVKREEINKISIILYKGIETKNLLYSTIYFTGND